MNRITELLTALRSAGIDAYYPGAHHGSCASPYAVVQQTETTEQGRSGGSGRYRVYLLVPDAAPSMLDRLRERALTAISDVAGLRLTVRRSTVLVNERYGAVWCYIEYVSEYSNN